MRSLGSAPVDASVIILTRNGEKNIGSCLDMVFKQDFQGSLEVIVIDSSSTDKTPEIARRYPVSFHQIPLQEFGHGRTRNLGARLSQGKYILFLTQDAVPAGSHWLSSLLRELDSGEEVVGVYGRQLPMPGAYPMEMFFLSQMYAGERRVQRKADGTVGLEETFFSNVNSSIKKAVFDQSPFSDRIVMSEDQEWSRRMLEKGYTLIYCPEAAVYHSHNYTLRRAFGRFFDSGVSSQESFFYQHKRAFGETATRGMGYIVKEMRFLASHGYAKWIPFALVYEANKFLGLALGMNHRFLPLWLKVKLSDNKKF